MQEHNNEKDTGKSENMKNVKNKIIVLSGKGGVGKSTVSVNLAYSLALNGHPTGIMDIDIHGPSVAKMTGIEGRRLETNDGQRAVPIEAVNNLFVLSIASLLENPDDPVIWRGPAKTGVIKQFIEDIDWPELDFLVIDCPPGTGDEPLSAVQLLDKVTGAVIVSTPQDVAFLDARKTINFAKKLNIPVLGIIENMAGFECPHCGKNIDIFKSGGAEKAARDFGIEILGKIPLDPEIVNSGDEGKPYVFNFAKKKGGMVYSEIVKRIINSCAL